MLVTRSLGHISNELKLHRATNLPSRIFTEPLPSEPPVKCH